MLRWNIRKSERLVEGVVRVLLFRFATSFGHCFEKNVAIKKGSPTGAPEDVEMHGHH
jgi:hypothetical protein